MDRESYDVSVRVSGDARPELAVDLTGSARDVTDRLSAPDGGQLPAADVDVTYRETEGERPGVLGLANRLTGEFVLEANVASDRVDALVDAVIEADGDRRGEYRVRLTDGDRTAYLDQETLLVYDDAGNLLRGRSLIPGGVEL